MNKIPFGVGVSYKSAVGSTVGSAVGSTVAPSTVGSTLGSVVRLLCWFGGYINFNAQICIQKSFLFLNIEFQKKNTCWS